EAARPTWVQPHAGPVWSVAFSPDGRWLATTAGGFVGFQFSARLSGKPGEILIWDWRNRRVRTTLKGHKDLVAGLGFSGDGKTLPRRVRTGPCGSGTGSDRSPPDAGRPGIPRGTSTPERASGKKPPRLSGGPSNRGRRTCPCGARRPWPRWPRTTRAVSTR